jgi:hypothetical protein
MKLRSLFWRAIRGPHFLDAWLARTPKSDGDAGAR